MNNLHRFKFTVSKEKKSSVLNYNPKVIWFFGYSGSGKSTYSNELEKHFIKNNIVTVQIDADYIRSTLNSDLGFSEIDRIENIRRVSEVAKLLFNNGIISLCNFITPTEKTRNIINSIIGRENIIWVFLNTPINVCMNRDPKGLYNKAINNKIENFTGLSQSFEIPFDYDFILNHNDDFKKKSEILFQKIFKLI